MASIENAFRNYVEYPYDGQSLARSRRNAAEKPTEIGLPFASHTPHHRFRKWEFDDCPAQITPSEFFLKKQIIHLLQINSYRLDEGEFNELYPSALTALENLFTSGEGNAFRKWSAMEFRLKTIIGLRAGLLKFYGAGYPMVHPIDSMPKNSLSAANFDLIYMQFLIKHLLSYLDVNKVKEKLTRPAQLLAFIAQTKGFPVSTDIFLQTDIDQLGASQRRHLDLAALLDNYSHQGNAFSATPTNMRESLETLRDNFIARLNQDVKIHQIIDRVLHPIIKHPANPRYDTIAFVNATGKNFDYFKDRVVSEATRQGLGLTPAALKAATKRYFNSLGESTQFTIGTLEHSLHSIICLRYDGFFKKTPLALPPTLAQLKEQLEHYDRLWEASDKPGSVMKPSVMAGLHLMHSRGVCFVDTDWGARLWEKTIKAEVAAILKEEQAQWSNCAELPFSDLSQNAADAFKAFSSFKMVDTGKTECVSTILTMGENRSLLAIKNRKIQFINERILALREKYLATERLSSDGDPVKELSMAHSLP